jgi:RHS repeat-associated protein
MDTRYRYNGKGQITYAEYSDGTWESYSYDKDGLLIAAQNEYSHITLKRDGNGRILAETQSRGIADEGHTVTSYYDEDGLRLHIGSTLGADIIQAYNEQGQLKHITSQGWEAHIERNARGQATAYEFTGGVQSSFAYDNAGRPIAQTVKTGLGRESYKRSYHWNAANQLVQTIDHVKNKGISYTYDALNQLVSATGGIEPEYKCPDAVGNLYETPERKDKTYSSGGRLERDKNWYYYYDTKGNLQLKSPYPLHGKDPSKKWQMGCWHYEWFANGMLKSVQKPSGAIVSFEYDALGRRIAKIFKDTITRYIWDGNVLLHEWKYSLKLRPELVVGDLGELYYDAVEPTDDITTWVYEEGDYVPVAKLINGERFSIISDYIGRPIQVFNDVGEIVWETEYDIYGRLKNLKGDRAFQPFRQLGQIEDVELDGLYLNRFRFYDSHTGLYISQDPIGLFSEEYNFYSYVDNVNQLVDKFGLLSTDPGVYDVFYESFLSKDMWMMSDRKHFQEGNRQLYNAMNNDPNLKNAMESKYPGIYDHVSPGKRGAFKGTAFKGTTWHHHPEVGGLLQLVDRADHNTRFPDYHPNGYGGRNKWGGGSVCR